MDFDPTTAKPLDAFDPETARPIEDHAAEEARQKIEEHISGHVTYDPETLTQLNHVAQEGKGPWSRLGSAAYDILSEPKKDVEAALEFGKRTTEGAGKAAAQIVEPFIEAGKTIQEKGISGAPEAYGQFVKGQLGNTWDLLTGAATGLGGLATTGVSLGNEVGDLALAPFGVDTTGNDVAVQELQNRAAKSTKEFTEATGTNTESPLYKAGENVIPALAPIGAELAGAKTTAKIAEGVVENAPKVAGAALKTAGKAGQTVGPAALATTELAHGHPYGALITLAAGYGPDGLPIIGKLKHAIIDKGFGAVNELGTTLMKTQDGVPVMKSLQDSVGAEIGRLSHQAQDILKKNPEKAREALKTIPDGRPLYKADELSGEARRVREIQDQISSLEGRYNMLGKFVSTNQFLSSLTKYGIRTGLNVGEAGAVGATFAGANAAPGNKEAIREGFGMGIALGAPFANKASYEGRLALSGDKLAARGSKNLPTDHPEYTAHQESLSSLPEPAQRQVNVIAGLADAMGKKVVVLPPNAMMSKIHPQEAMPPTEGLAPNGATIGDTLYLNRDALQSGVAGHELTHGTQEFFGKTLREAAPELMEQFEKTYSDRLSKTGDFEFKPEEERDAEVGRILLQSTPPEAFYGGKQAGDTLKSIVSNFADKYLPDWYARFRDKMEVDPILDAPVSKRDTSQMRERMFDLGELASRPRTEMPEIIPATDLSTTSIREGKAIPRSPATSTPPESRNARTGSVSAPIADPEIPLDVVKSLKKKGFSDEQIANIDPESIVQKWVPEIVPVISPEANVPSAPVEPNVEISNRRSSPQPTKMPEIVKADGQSASGGPQLLSQSRAQAPAPSARSIAQVPELIDPSVQSSSDTIAHPDYSAIRQEAETLKREELKGTNRKTKEAEIARAGIEAMMQKHAEAAGPNDLTFRTNRFGKTSISGKSLDLSNPAIQSLVKESGLKPDEMSKLQALESNMGQAIAIDYLHAPEEQAASGITRKGEQAEATASERVAQQKATRRLSKSYVPTNITYNIPSKTFEVNGFSPDKFLNNAATLIPWAKTKGLEGWKSINDPALVTDFQNGMENYRNGYSLSGKPIEGTDITAVKPNPGYKPHVLAKDKVDLLVAMMVNDIKLGVRKPSAEKLDKLELARKNAPFYEPETGETSKVRKMLGEESKLLESVSETLRPELIDKVRAGSVDDQMTLRPSGFKGDRTAFSEKGTPRSDFSASFMPGTSYESPKLHKGAKKEDIARLNTANEIKNLLWDQGQLDQSILYELDQNRPLADYRKVDVESALQRSGIKKSYDEFLQEQKDTLKEDKSHRIEFTAHEGSDIFDWAKQHHGTSNLDSAGYVLPNGEMLDFSGSRFGGGGGRVEDHRQIQYPGRPGSGTEAMVEFQKAGAIRIDANSGLIDLETAPTSSQERIIRQILEQNPQSYIDLQDGGRRAHIEPMEGAGSKALGQIRRFYNGEDIQNGPQFMPKSENQGIPDIKETKMPNLSFMPIPDKLQKTAEQYNLRFEGESLGGKAIAFTDMITGSTQDFPSDISPEQLASEVLKHRALFNRRDKIGE